MICVNRGKKSRDITTVKFNGKNSKLFEDIVLQLQMVSPGVSKKELKERALDFYMTTEGKDFSGRDLDANGEITVYEFMRESNPDSLNLERTIQEYKAGMLFFESADEAVIWEMAKAKGVETAETTNVVVDVEDDVYNSPSFGKSIDPRFAKIEQTLRLQLSELNKYLDKIRSEKEVTTDPARSEQLVGMIEDAVATKKTVQIRLAQLQTNAPLTILYNVVEEMFKEVRDQINKKGDEASLGLAQRTIELIELMGDFSRDRHPIISKAALDELKRNPEMMNPTKVLTSTQKANTTTVIAIKLAAMASEASVLKDMLNEKIRDTLKQDVVLASFPYMSADFVLPRTLQDINLMEEFFLSMDRYDSTLMQGIFSRIKSATHKAEIDADETLKEIEDLFKDLSQSDKEELYTMMQQTFDTEEGTITPYSRQTGSLIHPFNFTFLEFIKNTQFAIEHLAKGEEAAKYGGRLGFVLSQVRKLHYNARQIPIYALMYNELKTTDTTVQEFKEPDLYDELFSISTTGVGSDKITVGASQVTPNGQISEYYTTELLWIQKEFQEAYGARWKEVYDEQVEDAMNKARRYISDKSEYIHYVETQLSGTDEATEKLRAKKIRLWMVENSPFMVQELMRAKGSKETGSANRLSLNAQISSERVIRRWYEGTSMDKGGLNGQEISNVTSLADINFKYTTLVPRTNSKKVVSNQVTGSTGKTTTKHIEQNQDIRNEYFDKGFEKLLNHSNKNYFKIWEKTLSTLKHLHEMLPYDTRTKMGDISLPEIYKTLYEQYKTSDNPRIRKFIGDKIKRSLRDDDQFLQNYTLKDVNDRDVDTIGLVHINFHEKEINSRVRAQMIIELDKNPINKLSETEQRKKKAELRARFRRDVMAEIASRKTTDMETILKAYALTANDYKHKVKIEPLVRMAYKYVRDIAEATRMNAKGEVIKDPRTREEALEKLTRMENALRNNLDAFYNYNLHEKEGVIQGSAKLNKRVLNVGELLLTEEEKNNRNLLLEAMVVLRRQLGGKSNQEIEALAELTGAATNQDARNFMKLQNEYDALDKAFVSSKAANSLAILTHFIGIGYNFVSAFNNLNFGIISGAIRASKGDAYSEDNYYKALYFMLKSTRRFWLFNKYDDVDVSKLRAVMERLRILKEAKNEIYSSSRQSGVFNFFDRFKNLKAYNLQARSDYFAQGTQFLAMMLEIKATSGGETKRLWDFLKEDGSFPEDISADFTYYDKGATNASELKTYSFKGAAAVTEQLKLRADDVIKADQGNYDRNAIVGAKRKVMLRILMIFKSWMAEAVRTRLGSEQYNYQLGVTTKGRYRSGFGANILLGASLGVPVPFMVSYSKIQKELPDGTKEDVSAFEQSMFATKMLWRKLLGWSHLVQKYDGSDFDKFGYAYVDAMNMRANVQEAVFHLMLFMFAMILKYMVAVDEEDGEKTWASYASLFFLNSAGRLVADTQLWLSPKDLFGMLKPSNLAPVWTIFEDIGKIYSAGVKTLYGQSDYETGIYAGRNRLLHTTGMATPIVRNIYKQVDAFTRVQDPDARSVISRFKNLED